MVYAVFVLTSLFAVAAIALFGLAAYFYLQVPAQHKIEIRHTHLRDHRR